MDIDLIQTLDRIGYTGPRNVSASVLRTLHEAFLLAVPFENLDIHYGRTISLNPDAIEKKIIQGRRGGFCFECNSMCYRMLEALGFRVKMCSAQMMCDDELSPAYDHMILIAEIDSQEYLVDVGNGESIRIPMRLDSQEVSKSPEGKEYRIGQFDSRQALEVREANTQDWNPRFVINPTACKLEEFADRCLFHQTSKQSHFTRQPLVTLALPDGRATLVGRSLKITRAKTVIMERELENEEQYRNCLCTLSGVSM